MFDSDPLDCAETSPAAYEDVAPMVRALLDSLGTPAESAQLYDPYFCAGAVVRRLGRLGFPNVYNRNEDFYQVQAGGRVPHHDVVVTNPPYSADHVDKLCRFLAGNRKPFFCLVPSYVLHHPSWQQLVGGSSALCLRGTTGKASAPKAARPRASAAASSPSSAAASGSSSSSAAPPLRKDGFFFIAPRRRYSYYVPKGMQGASGGSANGKKRTNTGPRGAKTSPFISLWLCWAGEHAKELVSKPFRRTEPQDSTGSAAGGTAGAAPRPPPAVTQSVHDLPKGFLGGLSAGLLSADLKVPQFQASEVYTTGSQQASAASSSGASSITVSPRIGTPGSAAGASESMQREGASGSAEEAVPRAAAAGSKRMRGAEHLLTEDVELEGSDQQPKKKRKKEKDGQKGASKKEKKAKKDKKAKKEKKAKKSKRTGQDR